MNPAETERALTSFRCQLPAESKTQLWCHSWNCDKFLHLFYKYKFPCI